MDFSSGIFAFFINDFLYPDLKIGEVKLCYDSISDDFIAKYNEQLRYPKDVVLEDSHFLVFREYMFKDVDGEYVLEVEPYKMQVD